VTRLEDSGREDVSRVLELAWANPELRMVVRSVSELGVPHAAVTSGAVFQSVWNGLCDRPPSQGIGDYDVFYFESDLSAEREQFWQAQVAAACPGIEVEVANQARVHLWYESYFGYPCPPMTHALESLERFLSPTCAVAIRMTRGGRPELIAPFGVTDLLAMTVRPNTNAAGPEHYRAKVAKWSAKWPLNVVPWESTAR